jgi:hypothetical protein
MAMKRAALFVALAIALDFLLGAVLKQLDRRTMSGDRGGLLNYALTKDAQILGLGSSRAEFHIMPSVLSRRLSMTSYNAGSKGQDFYYAMMVYDLWKRRHPAPRAIVLVVDIESLTDCETEIPAAQIVASYIDESDVTREILYSGGPFKRYEYLSQTYRYNGKLLSMAKHLLTQHDPNYDGFRVAPGALDPKVETGVLNALDQSASQMQMAQRPFSPQKLRYLRQLAEESRARNTQLFLLHTPLYRQDDAAHELWMKNLRRVTQPLPNVQIIDLCTASHPEVFAGKPALYRNLNHLNERGAEVLTEMLADELEKSLSPKPTAETP